MFISHIFAISENNVIGHDKQLVWSLPNDFKFFKSHTHGHPILMGRKTFESLGKPLPGRTNIVITRDAGFTAEGTIVVHSIDSAIEEAKKVEQEEIFVIGGAAIFSESLPLVNKIYLTEVKAKVEGNITYNFDRTGWKEVSREDHFKDENHAFDYSFVILVRA